VTRTAPIAADGATAVAAHVNTDMNQGFNAINDHADDIEDLQDRVTVLEGLSSAVAVKYRLIVAPNAATPLSKVDVDASVLGLTNGTAWLTVQNVNLTIDITASGINGLDAGAEANNTWYSIWVIYNGATISGLLSLSATAPTFPAGYTYYRRVGWVHNTVADFAKFYHDYDSDLWLYDEPPSVFSAAAATWNAAAWATQSYATWAPTTSRRALLNVLMYHYDTGTAGQLNYVQLRPTGSTAAIGLRCAACVNPTTLIYGACSETIEIGINATQQFDWTVNDSLTEAGSVIVYAAGYYDPI